MKISQQDRDKIKLLRQELASLAPEVNPASYSELELDSYIRFQRTIPMAAKSLIASRKYKQEHPITIKDVAPFYRAPANHAHSSPPACLVCLEDGKGEVARDNEGRPIICMQGIVYGSEEELRQQIAYALQRAAQYRLPHHRPDEVCFVTEAMSRETKGLSPTFRFPDANVRSLFDFMKRYYPGSQFSVLHFCGLPIFVVGFFKMVKPFVSEEMFSRLKLKNNFSHLKKDGYVDTSSLLPIWDKEGTFRFDLNEYVEWRAKEEGIPLDEVCPRGQGRTYDGSLLSLLTLNPVVTTQEVLGTPEGKERVVKSGWGEKQGSGMGLFATNRWKNKYLVLTTGLLLYFENAKVSTSNAASKLIVIDEASSVRRLTNTEGDKRHIVSFQSEAREYIFAFDTEKEADEWVQALQEQCNDSKSAAGMVIPSKVSSLCVGDFEISKKDRTLSATLRCQ